MPVVMRPSQAAARNPDEISECMSIQSTIAFASAADPMLAFRSTMTDMNLWLRQNVAASHKFIPSRFDAMADLFAHRIKVWQKLEARQDSQASVAVVVTPWKQTAVPFFALELALMLRRAGSKVRLILDFCDLDGNACKPAEISAIRRVVAMFPTDVAVEEIRPAADASPSPEDLAAADAIAFDHAVIEQRGETNLENYFSRRAEAKQLIAEHLCRIEKVIDRKSEEFCLVPGGIYGTSATYVELASRRRVDLTTYDSGDKMIVFAHGGVAGHQHDIPGAHRLLRDLVGDFPGFGRRVSTWAKGELDERIGGRGNYLKFQSTAARGEGTDCDVLIPMNLRWDAAALGRQDIFPSVHDWISFLLCLAGELESVSFVFRQHPAERIPGYQSSDDFASFISARNPDPRRIRFVAAADPVNTYDLLRNCKLVLPQTSSIGVEAGMLGIPVVLAGPAYYDSFSFVQRATSRENYEKLIRHAINPRDDRLDETRRTAEQVYYLVQKCNLVPSLFSAETSAFTKWARIAPKTLWSRPELVDLQDALTRRVPLAFNRAKRDFAQWRSEEEF
jgi:hypothetical protein